MGTSSSSLFHCGFWGVFGFPLASPDRAWWISVDGRVCRELHGVAETLCALAQGQLLRVGSAFPWKAEIVDELAGVNPKIRGLVTLSWVPDHR